VVGLGGTVSVADHAAEAGAGCGQVGFQLSDASLQAVVVGCGLLGLVGQVLVVAGQFVDAGDQVLGGDGFQLVAELVAQPLA
jgi:hypothetical protein